jgi:mannose-6-phosphate isomerase-like protein (cupin superfamily)
MRIEKSDPNAVKGWYAGPWDSALTISVGYANAGVDQPHVHSRVTEIYMVARGTSEMRVERDVIALEAGDVLVVEPGEAHTFLSSSPDYFHFVAHVPGLMGEEARAEKELVPRSRLGL